jgi:hypothetical protein
MKPIQMTIALLLLSGTLSANAEQSGSQAGSFANESNGRQTGFMEAAEKPKPVNCSVTGRKSTENRRKRMSDNMILILLGFLLFGGLTLITIGIAALVLLIFPALSLLWLLVGTLPFYVIALLYTWKVYCLFAMAIISE